MYCTKCGKQIEDTANFCKYCGAATKQEHQIEPDQREKNHTIKNHTDTSGETAWNSGTPVNARNPSAAKRSSGIILPMLLFIGLLLVVLAVITRNMGPGMREGVHFVSWADAGQQDYVMEWQDADLEAAMREITMIYDRDIMLSDVWELTVLDLSSYAASYQGWNNSISNINALGSLTNLNALYLNGNNISDISALRKLTNLTILDLSYNELSDIGALGSLVSLTTLNLEYNQISDISVLKNLTNLVILALSSNEIYDISVLQKLAGLSCVYLWDNPVSDGDISNLPGGIQVYWEDGSTYTELQAMGAQVSGTRETELWQRQAQEQDQVKEKEQEKEKAEEEKSGRTTKNSQEASKKTEDALSGDYVIADSNSRYLNSSELQKFSLKEINYAKNEIYARRGRKFQSKELQDYFNSKSWYKGTIELDAFLWDTFNDYEKVNAELLSKVEFERDPKGYLLDQ